MRARELEIWLDDDANTAGVWRKSVLVQARRGALDPRLFLQGEAFLDDARRSRVPVGMLAVVEAGAPLPSQEVRRQQRALIDRFGAYEQARIAAVVLGDDVGASLARSAARLVGVANPRIERFVEVTPAVSWLAHELSALGLPTRASELFGAIEAARRQGGA